MVYGCGLPMILIVVFHDVPIAMVNDQRLIRMNNWMNQFRISPTNAIFGCLKGTIAGSNGSVMRNGDVQKSDFQRRPAFGSNVAMRFPQGVMQLKTNTQTELNPTNGSVW